ncbi:MAG: dockerin type I repeat-containing protein [Nannocystaceae bacterium]
MMIENKIGLGVMLLSGSLMLLAGCDEVPVDGELDVVSERSGGLACPSECETIGGDVNGDGQVDISDMIVILDAFQYGDEQCDAAADVNGDGQFDISDTIALSHYLWSGGAAPLAPIAPGDVNGDGAVDITDVSLLPGYLYGGSPAEVCQMGADANGDCQVDVADISVLTAWVSSGTGQLSSCPGQ